jgi:hypothetical protein
MTQHASLTPERWARFDLDQQILMIANEMNRASSLLSLDLTVATRSRRGWRRELLRWRDLVAALYIAPGPEPAAHAAAFRCLLQFTPVAARQIPHVLGAGSREP